MNNYHIQAIGHSPVILQADSCEGAIAAYMAEFGCKRSDILYCQQLEGAY
jgi:hypothetical protein